jgi:hypothetical protein
VPGRGATFSVEVPVEFKGKQLEALMPASATAPEGR